MAPYISWRINGIDLPPIAGAKAASAAISITTVNPVAEPTSVTIAKALQYAAAAGVI